MMAPRPPEAGVQRREPKISPKLTLVSAFVVHALVEVPYFIFPVIVLVVGQDLNLGELKWIGLGALGSLSALSAGLPAPIFGWLADRSRRGVLMVGSLLFSFIGATTIGFFGTSFLVLAIALVLLGLGIALYHPAGLSWITSAYSTADGGSYSPHFNRILGIHGVGGTIGSALAPITVYFLIDIIHWQQIYLLLGILTFIVAIGFWLLIGRDELHVNGQDSSGQSSQETRPLGNWVEKRDSQTVSKSVAFIFVFMFFFAFAYGMISFILAAFLSEIQGRRLLKQAYLLESPTC